MKKFFDNIPLWFVNLITIISGIITLASPVITFIGVIKAEEKVKWWSVGTIAVLICFCFVLFVRMKKYRTLAKERMECSSCNFHKTTHDTRDIFFDIMHHHKLDALNVDSLNSLYPAKLVSVLDYMCEILSTFTSKKVSASIKLICYSDGNGEEDIKKENAQLITFCRSTNSVNGRANYEKHSGTTIYLKDNTDFKEIIDDNNAKDYFYQSDLLKYKKQLELLGLKYENTNESWKEYYQSTIVVPIRVEFKRLYHMKRDDAYHIIGFLCVDSESTDAFTEKQEKYNVDIVNAFADVIYILLSQYRHYLKSLYKEKVKVKSA